MPASCRYINFVKIYEYFGVNSFHLKSWLCKIFGHLEGVLRACGTHIFVLRYQKFPPINSWSSYSGPFTRN